MVISENNMSSLFHADAGVRYCAGDEGRLFQSECFLGKKRLLVSHGDLEAF